MVLDVEDPEGETLLEDDAAPLQGESLHRRVRIYSLLLLAFVAVLGGFLISFGQSQAKHKQSQSMQDLKQTMHTALMQKFVAQPVNPCQPGIMPPTQLPPTFFPAAVAPQPTPVVSAAVAPQPAPVVSPIAQTPVVAPIPWILMPMGDSITEGQGSPMYGGYRCPLSSFLDTRGIYHSFVGPLVKPGNCGGYAGYPGATMEVISLRARSLVAEFVPDVVLLQAGTNDFFLYGHGRLGGADVQTATMRLRYLLGEIYAAKPTVTVALSTVTAVNETLCALHWQCPNSMPYNIANFNALLPGIVNEFKQQFHRIELHDVNAVANWRLEDFHQWGMHFSNIGYTKIANAWLNALLPLAPTTAIT